ncbi:conserved hypothetical protein [Desulfosarcina cetonica]|uniref:thrombospondin type 3 repeat-containing protein n=1 Tax=Desulfosarcina cetonica TaxID=90730 RepID=UPI0006D0192B|nr:thrombospondin type 3 repeat-containing protein [Desulfosarcina cetonica]VTR71448.1 conserved hypothetical protein [Desulfosarcina cetonica]
MTTPNGPIADRDLIPDNLDNCKATANILQTDSDGDGYGNPCDCDVDNNGLVAVGDYWFWRLLATIDPESSQWDASVDFNGDGPASYADYLMLMGRYRETVPFE